jgi:glycosyltransferase involved in cell wall biosynthesis
LSAQKDLPRALQLFARVRENHPSAHYLIIGPDGDDTARVHATVQALGLQGCVSFLGPMAFEDICQRVRGRCFYLQTSRYEGMAMSVVEAMQLGLVPVVTPVGEVAAYCVAGVNAVLVNDEAQAAAELTRLLNRAAEYQTLRISAIQRWQHQPLYAESVLAACEALLSTRQSPT